MNANVDIYQTLNPDQREAVFFLDAPLLLIAGAGSGKTKVITNKIAYLIKEKNYAPYNILGVTFTNKAAAEMKSRIETLTGIDGKYFNIFTFHALGLRIMRESGAAGGFSGDWHIIDDQDQKKILERIIKSHFSYFTNDMRDDVKRKINFAKMDLNYPNNKDLLLQKGFKEDEFKIFFYYYQYQKENKVWDYEDLVSLPVKLLQSNEDLREKYREKFRYVVVDEFQDTNPNQYELITLIAGKHKNITIVGDDDQAIYSWRGASIRFLFNFEDDFPGAHIIKLQQNYRSTPQILEFSNNLISKNSTRRDKSMWTDKEAGQPVCVFNCKSKEEEAAKVGNFIQRLRIEKPELFPVAILYRINSQSLAYETEFSRQGIEFKIIKGLRFFDRKEIKDSIALLRLAINLDDDISFLRVIDFLPVGIGPKTLETLNNHTQETKKSLFSALREIMPDKYNSKEIFSALYRLNREQSDYTTSELLTSLLKRSGYQAFLEDKGEQDRLLNINELVEFIKKWETASPQEKLADLMDRMCLDGADTKDQEGGVSVFLLTMHNAKGLEFPTVVVAGINATYMPFFLSKSRQELEEERRLFYVAATRAINFLVVSVGGDKVSRFLTDINYYHYTNAYSVDDIFDAFGGARLSGLPEMEILQEVVEEKFVEHPIFGKGRIVNSVGKDKYIIDFVNRGEKTIDTSIVAVKFL